MAKRLTRTVFVDGVAYGPASAIPEDVATQVYALTGYTGSASNLAKITLGTDNVFSDGWDQQVASVTGDASSGYTVSIDVPIDTTTEQEMSENPRSAPVRLRCAQRIAGS